MPVHPRRLAIAAVLAAVAAGALPGTAAAAPPLVGHWTFSDATGGETTGNWSDIQLFGTGSIAGGELNVDGTNGGDYGVNAATGWARSNYTGAGTIADKTLVAWVRLDDLTPFGSPLSLTKDNEDFDAIVYGERQANRWMAGSEGFNRTQDFASNVADTAVGTLRQVAISYENVGGQARITGCLDGVQLGQYTKGLFETFAPADGVYTLFGPRHLDPSSQNPVGAINAHIDESSIYGGPMTCAEAFALPRPGTDSISGSGTIGTGTKTNNFAFDAYVDGGGDETGTIVFEQANDAAKVTNGDVVCFSVSGNRGVIVYEEDAPQNPATPGGLIRVIDGSPDAQKNGKLRPSQIEAYRTNGCSAPVVESLNAISSGDIAIVDN